MLYLNNNCKATDLSKEFDNFFKNGFFGNGLKADLEEKDNNYILTVDAPGVDKKDINIDFNEGYLTISVSQKFENDIKKKYLVRERGYSEVSRSFYLEDADQDSIKARLENGVLTITMDKQKKVDNKKVISID